MKSLVPRVIKGMVASRQDTPPAPNSQKAGIFSRTVKLRQWRKLPQKVGDLERWPCPSPSKQNLAALVSPPGDWEECLHGGLEKPKWEAVDWIALGTPRSWWHQSWWKNRWENQPERSVLLQAKWSWEIRKALVIDMETDFVVGFCSSAGLLFPRYALSEW